MKDIKQIREHLEEVSEVVDSNTTSRKLNAMVREGLFESNRVHMLQRALDPDNMKLTRAEHKALLEAFDNLTSHLLAPNQPDELLESDIVLDEDTKTDIDITRIPAMLVMRRRAIRVFPDGQKVALYWVDRIGKYISVPFSSIGLSEGVNNTPRVGTAPHMARINNKPKPKTPKAAPAPKAPVKPAATGGTSASRAQAAYHERMKRAGSRTDDDPESEIEKHKAAKNFKHVERKVGKTSTTAVRAAVKGEQEFNKAKEHRDKEEHRKWQSSWENIGTQRTSVKVGATIAKGVEAAGKAVKKIKLKEGIASAVTSYVGRKLATDKKQPGEKEERQTRDRQRNAVGDSDKEKTTKDVAFGGRGIKVSNSFDNAIRGSSAEDKRRDRLDRATQRAMSGRSTAVSEENLNVLKSVDLGQTGAVLFEDGSTLEITKTMAAPLVETYNRLRTIKNRRLFLEMINKDKTNFMKAYNFSREQ